MLLTASQARQAHSTIGPMMLEYVESWHAFYPLGWIINLVSQFETFHEETDPVHLKVSGRIPAYAA